MRLDHQRTPYTKISSIWIKDLNISHNTRKVLEENMGRKISDIPCNNIFTDMSPRARGIKERMKKWDLRVGVGGGWVQKVVAGKWRQLYMNNN